MTNEIKTSRELGRLGYHKWILQPCLICGELRWVQLVADKARHHKPCRSCATVGRPRLKTLEELQQLAPVAEIKLKEVGGSFMGLLNTRGRGYSVIAGNLSQGGK